MRYTIRRYMDDGYGSVHLIEEYYTDDASLIESAIELWEGDDPSLSEVEESFHSCEYKEITDSSNFNPRGSGNNVDELRIFDGEKQIYTVG